MATTTTATSAEQEWMVIAMDNTSKGVEIDPFREKLIEVLKGNATCLSMGIDSCESCPHGHDEDCYTSALVDHLIANGVTIQKWIPVTERLPEEGAGDVLVVKQFRGKPYVDIGEVIGETACCYSDEYCIRPREHIFTHWMPLLEPPKEVE